MVSFAEAQDVAPEPIRKIEDIYFQGSTPLSSKEVKRILKSSGNPEIMEMMDSGRNHLIFGSVLMGAGLIAGLIGLSMNTEDTGAYTYTGPVYVDNGTDDGLPLMIGGLAAMAVGGIIAYVGTQKHKKAIGIYNEQVAGVSVTLLEWQW